MEPAVVTLQDRPSNEAIQWLLRVRDGDVNWEQLTFWLEADEQNRTAFDRLSSLDQQLAPLVGLSDPRRRRRPHRGWWTAAGITSAAAAAAAIAFVLLAPQPDRRFETAPGQSREIALADGSRIELNGASILVVNAHNERSVRLEKGEAFFEVVHDVRKPFRVQAGDAAIEDVGTTFDVLRDGAQINVGVKTGAVLLRVGEQSVKLIQGMVLSMRGSDGLITRADAAEIGSWRSGEISYAGASLERVARDLERTRGLRIEVGQQLAATSFSGTIQLHGSDAQVAQRIADLTGTRLIQTSGGWRLVPHGARGD